MRVLTLNLWNINHPWRLREQGLLEFLRDERPDLVALQEVSFINGRPQINDLAAAAGYEYVYSPSGTWLGRDEGLAVLFRGVSLSLVEVLHLPEFEGDMQRILQVFAVELPTAHGARSLILFCNTHLAFALDGEEARREQTSVIGSAIAQYRQQLSASVILCGDFNAEPVDGPLSLLLNDPRLALVDSWSALGLPVDRRSHTYARENGWTTPALAPGRRIDYILLSAPLVPLAARLALTGNDGYPPVSDHYGVLVDVGANA